MIGKRFYSLVAAFVLSVATLANGADVKPPVVVIDGLVDIGIRSVSGPHAAEIREVLKRDLDLSGRFNVIASSATSYLIEVASSSQSLQGKVLKKSGNPIFSRDFSFASGWRRATHELADAIVLDLLGEVGFATSKVTFISARTGNKEIYIMDIDGHDVKQLTSDRVISLGPKFSKDGNLISYTSYKTGYPDAWVIDLNSKKRRRVSFFPGINSGSELAPNGGRIALTLSKDGNTELYTISAEGGDPRRLTRTRGTEATPSWSPDGSKIAYVSDERGSPQIYIVSVSGGAPRRIRTNSLYTTEPDWSPDGQKIAYSIMTAGQMQIGCTDISTGKQKILTSSGRNETPSWTRNSRHLVYAHEGNLYLVDSETAKSIPVQTKLTKCSEPNCSL